MASFNHKSNIKKLMLLLNSDSKKVSTEAKNKIILICKPIIDEITKLNEKYNVSPIHFDGYDENTKIDVSYFQPNIEDEIEFEHASEIINFKYEWFSPSYIENYEKRCITLRTNELHNLIAYHSINIEQYINELKKIKNE